MWTMTYRVEPADLKTVKRHLRLFQHQVSRLIGRLPLVAVVELGSEGGRLHVHLGAPRFLSIELMSRCWPHGFVWVGDAKRIKGRMAVGQLASYLAKYLSKGGDGLADDDPKGRAAGAHRYSVTEGFQPELVTVRAATAAKALAGAMELMGEPDLVIAWDLRPDAPAFGYWVCWPAEAWHPPPP